MYEGERRLRERCCHWKAVEKNGESSAARFVLPTMQYSTRACVTLKVTRKEKRDAEQHIKIPSTDSYNQSFPKLGSELPLLGSC